MTQSDTIQVFDSQGERYKHAFQVFLNHTDQKRNATRWLQLVVEAMPVRKSLSMPEPEPGMER